ncbi:hypothetical protein BMS3Abin03_01356 [bacterium BMS3Abin03]|nr:hypothetical protein BMS3Abin03_01356 [bacterium BMS3Abin03]
MSLSKEQQVFTQHVALLITRANSMGVNLTFGEAWRTKEQQAIYVKQGKSRTMDSNHLKRLAVDFNFFIAGTLFYRHPLISELGNYWESLDRLNRWGGHFQFFYDGDHFERNII